MPTINISSNIPIVGQPNSSEEPKIPAALNQLASALNGNLDDANLTTAFKQKLIQLTSSSNLRKCNFGSNILGGPAGSGANAPYSNITSVSHGLGLNPAVIVVTATYLEAYVSVVGIPNSSSFLVQGKVVPGGFMPANSTWGTSSQGIVGFTWLAIG